MRYQQTLEIHQRLEAVFQLIGTGRYSTPALAEAVGVSIPTISRIVAALREQGHDIRAERHDGGWQYVLHTVKAPRSQKDRLSDRLKLDIRRQSKSRLANQDKSPKNSASANSAVRHNGTARSQDSAR